jgi:selenocysteine-specific elongation factor
VAAAPSLVIGTAGHIDHGKTSLVRALTGIDTDRLKEEKERGITIELGFAHLTLPSGMTVGVVDVPGHERFVRTMVAGAVGIDLVVLVVAADEGVMPQTREHLDICGLLGVGRGVVALTKADLVDDELRALAAADVAEALRGTTLAGAPIVPCSAKTGAGLPELTAAIARALADAPGRDPEGLVRLPIDRVFSMKGFGTVVTGTLWAGRVAPGDDLVALPAVSPTVAKVRGVQVHGGAVAAATAGQRTALNLAAPREVLARGQVLVRPGELEAGRLVDARVRLLPSALGPMKRRARVQLHAGTASTLATVTLLDRGALDPGGEALAQVQLDHEMVLMPGDRFVLRGFVAQRNHGTTVGGGVVLRTLGARHRRATPELLEALRATERAQSDGDAEARVLIEVERAGTAGIARAALQMRLPTTPRATEAALSRLLSTRAIIRVGRSGGDAPVAPRPEKRDEPPPAARLARDADRLVIARAAFEALRAAALAAVDAHHAARPLDAGLPREELRTRLVGAEGDARLAHAVVESLERDGELEIAREVVRRRGHDPARAQAATSLAPLAERVGALYREAALQPPRPVEAAAALGVDRAELERALDLLARGRVVTRVKDLWFHADALAALRARLCAFLDERGQIAPQEWKELVGGSRKFAIPLAEYFDAEKVTLRIGDIRKLRR